MTRTCDLPIDVRPYSCNITGMALTASKLRENIYRILDQVLETGVPVEIVRKQGKLEIVRLETERIQKLDNLKAHPDALAGDPEDLVHVDWSREWKP